MYIQKTSGDIKNVHDLLFGAAIKLHFLVLKLICHEIRKSRTIILFGCYIPTCKVGHVAFLMGYFFKLCSCSRKASF